MAQYIAKEIKCATTNASQASVTGLAQTNKNCLVGKDGGWCRSYLDFDFSGISDDVVVTSAYLKFYVFARDSIYMNYADSRGYVYIGKMTSLWNESELNWSNKPSQIKTQTVKVPSTGIITIDITTIVQDWFTNPSTRYGIELSVREDSIISGAYYKFYNHYSDNQEYVPYIEINYEGLQMYKISEPRLREFGDEIRRITGKTNGMTLETMLTELKTIPTQTS